VFVVPRLGVQLPGPFLDVSADVQFGGEAGGCCRSSSRARLREPSRKLYAYLRHPQTRRGDPGGQIVVDKFTAASDDHVDKSTRQAAADDRPPDGPQPQTAGTLAFGPRRGGCTRPTGDGGSGNDAHHTRPERETPLLGKLIVIDRVHGGASVFSLGPAQPVPLLVRTAPTGDMVIADVGQGRRGGGRLRAGPGPASGSTTAGPATRAFEAHAGA